MAPSVLSILTLCYIYLNLINGFLIPDRRSSFPDSASGPGLYQRYEKDYNTRNVASELEASLRNDLARQVEQRFLQTAGKRDLGSDDTEIRQERFIIPHWGTWYQKPVGKYTIMFSIA